MYAIKGNKEFRIDETEKSSFLAEGYSIYDDEYTLKESPSTGGLNEELEKLKAENKKLKAENTKLKHKLKGVSDSESEGQ